MYIRHAKCSCSWWETLDWPILQRITNLSDSQCRVVFSWHRSEYVKVGVDHWRLTYIQGCQLIGLRFRKCMIWATTEYCGTIIVIFSLSVFQIRLWLLDFNFWKCISLIEVVCWISSRAYSHLTALTTASPDGKWSRVLRVELVQLQLFTATIHTITFSYARQTLEWLCFPTHIVPS